GLSVSQYLDRLRDQGEFLDTQILRDAGDNVGSLMEGSWTQLEEYLYGVSGVNSAGNGNVFDSDSFWKNVANLREKINDIRHGPVIFGNEVTCFGDWQSRLVTQVLGWISGEKVSDMAMRDRLTCLNQLLVDKGYTFRLGRNEEIVVNEGETWTIREVKTAFSKLGLTPFD
ncbi:hypothetical protein JW962_03290, partial [Candidatus Dojkabacteria bacterium]|nr:hypothetical protein [Candidatus Dojkabacteria bacterium]